MSRTEMQFRYFVTLQRGFDLPKSSMVDGDVPVLGSKCAIGYHNEFKVEAPGVVTGRSGTLGLVQYSEQSFWPHNTTLWVKDFKGNNPKFVYYKLKTLRLERFNGGASVPTLNRNVLDTLSISIPRQTEQIRIAEILSAYDDLIENNGRRISLLEVAARLLYREWFVYFRFPGHEHVKIIDGVPEGWERCKVGSLIDLQYGKALKESDRVEGAIPVYGSSGRVGSHQAAIVEGPTIIVGRKGNVGSIHLSHESCWPIDTVYFVPKERVDFWLYLALPTAGFQNTDAGVPGLNRNFAYSRKLLRPSKHVRHLFNEVVKPMFAQQMTLEKYNRRLVETRDLLLPRLMNGEITV